MEELDLKELFKIFWNKKIEITLIVAIFIVIGVIYIIQFVHPVYSSSTTLLIASSNGREVSGDISSVTATEITVNSKLVSTYSELVRSSNILRTVIANLNMDIDEEKLKKNVKVSAVKDTEIIEITVTNEDANTSATIANEIAKVFIEKIQKEFFKIENIQVVDKAEPDYTPSNVNNKKDIAIFTGLGIIVSVVYVLILNMLDTTIKTVEDIENVYQIPVLVTIPVCDDNVQKSKKGGRRR